jgi:hypothetical protein
VRTGAAEAPRAPALRREHRCKDRAGGFALSTSCRARALSAGRTPLAYARRRCAPWLWPLPGVGGHPLRGGRFWRPLSGSPSRAPHRDPGRAQIRARRFSTDTSLFLDAPQRPAQPPQRQYLMLLLVAQNVGHPGGGARPLPPRQRLEHLLVVAGFAVSMGGRFWVSTEGRRQAAP